MARLATKKALENLELSESEDEEPEAKKGRPPSGTIKGYYMKTKKSSLMAGKFKH